MHLLIYTIMIIPSYMKKVLIIFMLVSSLFTSFVAAQGIDTQKRSKDDLFAAQAYTNAPDSIKLPAFDSTIHSFHYRFDYLKQKELISFFAPFYDRTICEPGNDTHPVYKQYMEEGNKLLSKAKEECIKQLTNEETRQKKLRGKVRDTDELQKCTFKLIPAYYLTYNVVSYSGENEKQFKSFFNLDTACYHYLVIKDNVLIYTFKYQNGRYLGNAPLRTTDSLLYSYALLHGKEPVGVHTNLKRPQFRGSYDILGYMENDQLILINCRQGQYFEVRDGVRSKEPVFKSECKTRTAKAVFINRNKALLQDIERAYQTLVGNENIKPIPGLEVKLKQW